MRCWWCGVEPLDVYDICVMEQIEPIRQIAHWPPGDHPHSDKPPTADELAAEAYRMLNERVR